MSEQKAACCGCGWTGTMDRAQGHIAECAKYAERWQADHDDECLDPGTEWERRQRELDEPEPDYRLAAARKRAENIRKAGVFMADTYTEAVLAEDWKVMGYDTLAQWRAGEFGMFRLTVEARRETSWLMLEAGQSAADIVEATGADERTIRRDLAGGDSTESGGHAVGKLPGASPPVAVSDKAQVAESPVSAPAGAGKPVSAGSGTNVSFRAEDSKTRPAVVPAKPRRQRCICPECGHGHARKGEK